MFVYRRLHHHLPTLKLTPTTVTSKLVQMVSTIFSFSLYPLFDCKAITLDSCAYANKETCFLPSPLYLSHHARIEERER